MERELKKLEKTVEFGTYILHELKTQNDLELKHKVLISIYRKLLEQTYGGYTLAINELVGPLKIMNRAVFETYLALKYILQKEELTEIRAYSYYIGFLKDVEAKYNDWKEHNQFLPPNESFKKDVEKAQEGLSNILNNPILEDVLIEWEKTREKSKREYNPKWHSLYNGPRTINRLAMDLMQEDDLVNTYYGALSHEAHGYASLMDSNFERFIDDEPLSLNPIAKGFHKGDIKFLRAFFLGGLVGIIKPLFPEYRPICSVFVEELGIDDEINNKERSVN
ncbi:hypothetical protein CN935_20310 [Bacillus cereus]|uniref:DUF5677 domain-containing protein n=1 Tax=Bacillus cereus TaxID=1396 RepID=UPI000BFE51DB|nr:DUF5677 domain-containing protein [Bacillus cereus]PGM07268.1 hypothetical protein CN935_20310 [Bacillus cereus]